MKQAILYFVKYPEPGKVKTRLAAGVGNVKAAALYKELAEKNFRTIKQTNGEEVKTVVVFDSPAREEDIKGWLKEADGYLAQKGNDLGERMTAAFEEAFAGEFEGAMAAGSDTLALTDGILRQALRELQSKDVVLGPAKDGGYYLIGLRKAQPSLFIDMPWSTPALLEETLARIRDEKLSLALLEELDDLDDVTRYVKGEFV